MNKFPKKLSLKVSYTNFLIAGIHCTSNTSQSGSAPVLLLLQTGLLRQSSQTTNEKEILDVAFELNASTIWKFGVS